MLARRRSSLPAATVAVCERAEDYDLWLRLAEGARLANLPDVLLDYRIRRGQISAGSDLDQRFAHDLALLAARERRAGRADPLDGAGDPLRFDRPFPADCRLPAGVAELVAAYGALAWFEGRAAPSPDQSALFSLVACARAALLGDGRRFRALSLLRCASLAVRRGDWRLAVAADTLALRIAPGRAARWVVAGRV